MLALLSRHWPLSIRLQLTLWYTAVFAALTLCSGALVYKYLENSLARSLDTALSLQAKQIASDMTVSNGVVEFHNTTGVFSDNDTTPRTSRQIAEDIDEGPIVRILDVHGQVLYMSPAFRYLQVPDAGVTQPLQGQTWQGTIPALADLHERIYSQPVLTNGRPFAVVQVGESITQIRSVLRDVAIVLLLIAPIVLLLSAVGSFWLASRAFRPIHRLTETARQIHAGDLAQRVPVPGAHDEVRFLALTLNEMIERLEGSFKRQRRFVSDASHELRTPVAAIRSKTDLALLQPLKPQEYVSVLQNINGEAERLGYLISDLLALARADEGRTRLELEPIRLDVLVETVAANAEALALERQIKLQLCTLMPVTLQADEARMIQVVMNLLDNALIYTQPGGCVTLAVEGDSQRARIRVSDNGEGIAPEHLPHIFERFYRADPARTRREGGSSGLGLSIADWVVRAHGGSITVDSTPGSGSTFTVTLPLVLR